MSTAGNGDDQARQADGLIAAWLRGEMPPRGRLPANLADRIIYHGVSGLLVGRRDVFETLDTPFRSAIHRQALAEAMWDLQHRRVIAPVLEDLARDGIPAAVLKGTALACSLYPSPGLRPRGDTDLLVAEEDLTKVRACLGRHGFRRSSDHLADRMTQEEWSRQGPDGGNDCIDLHWNLLRPWALSSLFDTGALLAKSRPLKRLSASAMMLDYPHALLHACVHRASHVSGAYFVGSQVHYGGKRLIWLVDIDLLARAMDVTEWQAFVDAAVGTRTARIAHEALVAASELIGTPLPEAHMVRLAGQAAGGEVEDYFIRASFLRRLWTDVRSVPRGQSRLAYLKEILLPPADVMRKDYPAFAHLPLYRLHFHRYAERIRRLRLERQQRRGGA